MLCRRISRPPEGLLIGDVFTCLASLGVSYRAKIAAADKTATMKRLEEAAEVEGIVRLDEVPNRRLQAPLADFKDAVKHLAKVIKESRIHPCDSREYPTRDGIEMDIEFL